MTGPQCQATVGQWQVVNGDLRCVERQCSRRAVVGDYCRQHARYEPDEHDCPRRADAEALAARKEEEG